MKFAGVCPRCRADMWVVRHVETLCGWQEVSECECCGMKCYTDEKGEDDD